MTICTIDVDRLRLRFFSCDSLKGHWAVGTAAVVVAHDKAEAARLLQRQVELEGMPHQVVREEQLKEIDSATPNAIIIRDGNY